MSTDPTAVGTVRDLHELAASCTEGADFGPDDYSEGLEVLLDSYAREAKLTPLGVLAIRETLRGALVARSLSEAAWQSRPDCTEIPIQQPIFVTGLPRTGTTALHRLLTADPTHQGLEMWLAERPQPRPPRSEWASNPSFQEIDAAYRAQRAANPDLSGMHYMDAVEVEECWRVLQQSMQSIAYECLTYVPTYSAWLAEQEWTNAYERHRRTLQLIGANDTDRRWVLKNPSHIFALDEILRVYPDALIVHTHRSPRTVIASMCSVNQQATLGWSEAFDPHTIGRTQLDLWARGMEKFTEARRRHDSAQFLDVEYDDFVADPLGTVATVYSHFGLDLTETALAAIHAMDDESHRGERKPVHTYGLAEFGLTAAQVDERFAGMR
ncbi:sulfotransferase [Nocardia cyriacigeorgica]|uniref:sulfotransferase family protein n=1 Tax=Nocardia cyriacigeorgica TaxID=135487 RepID=UPI0013B9C5D7|nr:sulfotransferase [Nocardia cyriacigeorgica]NEW51355.1 sulfotransferase [Nocardia cyriacigeorgica]